MLRYLIGKVYDRIAILISGFPQLESLKLLGVPIIPNTPGSYQHKAVVMFLEKLGVFNELIAQVFETTSSITGRFQKAATCTVKTLGYTVLWFACRHHASEAIFKRSQNEFSDLNRETKVRKFSN